MTERTYTETEVQAIRAATLREAAEKLVERAKQYQDEPDAWQALHVEAAYILAMIDQPDADALNAMIGAAYLDAASSLDERGSDGWAEHMAAEFAAVQGEAIRELTPADALAALERVKQAERERWQEAMTLIERVYYMEGKDAKWRAAHMNGIARDAQNGLDLAWARRMFPHDNEALSVARQVHAEEAAAIRGESE